MRTPLLLLLLAATNPVAHAQNWCPTGAAWTYTLSSWSAQGFSRFTYEGDTLFAGAPCQRIVWKLVYYDFVTETNIEEVFDTLYTTVDADLVSIWDGTAFDTLYDFAAVAGDTWQLSLENGIPDGWAMMVLDTGTNVVDGQSLHYQVIAQDLLPIDTVYARIGGLNMFMAPWWNGTVDGLSGPLRCYSDADLSYTAPWWNYGCTSTMGIEEEISAPALVTYPDPGTDHFTMVLIEKEAIVQVLDAAGRPILSLVSPRGSTTIDTSNWPPGCYIIRTGSGSHSRWVKL